MSRKFTFDTNVFIDASSTLESEVALGRFLARHAPRIYLAAVVILELRAGAVSDRQAVDLQKGVFDVFERRNRVLAPSSAAYKECGRVIAEISRSDGVPLVRRRPSFSNDVLIAATCREHGLTLISSDKDLALIRRHLRGFDFVMPWPE